MSDDAATIVTTRPIRIVLADDHPIVLEGLDQLFSLESDFEVVARARDGNVALRFVRELRPDILMLDLRMPGMDGLTVLREMRREKLPTRPVVLTAADGEMVMEALRLGVRGLVLKDMAPRLLVECVREVHAGGTWLERAVAARAVDKLLMRETSLQECAHVLTPRELEIACMLAQGLHNKAVAEKLSITEGTAKLHLHHVYQKLGVDGRMGLIRYLQERGLT